MFTKKREANWFIGVVYWKNAHAKKGKKMSLLLSEDGREGGGEREGEGVSVTSNETTLVINIGWNGNADNQ